MKHKSIRTLSRMAALALALTLIVGGLVGGLLMRGVTQRVMVLLNSVGSLI